MAKNTRVDQSQSPQPSSAQAKKNLTLSVDPRFHKSLKLYCIEHDWNPGELVQKLVGPYVNGAHLTHRGKMELPAELLSSSPETGVTNG